jgi:hypothetical protein
MHTRSKLALAALLTFAVVNMTAASAFGFSWWIEKSGGGEEVLKAGVKEPFNPAMTGSPTIVLTWGGNQVECTKGTYENGFLEGTVGIGAKAFIYESCKAPKPANCAVENAQIKTTELKGTIAAVGGGVEFQIKPVVGTTLAEFKLIGGGCSAAGNYIVTGSFGGSLTNPKELSKEKTFKIESERSHVSIGSSGASTSGEDGYSATKGWSAH